MDLTVGRMLSFIIACFHLQEGVLTSSLAQQFVKDAASFEVFFLKNNIYLLFVKLD